MSAAAAFLVSALGLTAAPAGDPVAEFARIAAAHQLERFDLAVEATFEAGMTVPAIRATVRRWAPGRELRSFGDLTILETPERRIAVDQGDRVIVIAERPAADRPTAGGALPPDPVEAFAAWQQRGASLSGGELTADGRLWTVESPGGRLRRARLYVDARTRLVRRLDYEIDAGEGAGPTRVRVTYTWRDASRLRRRDFDEKRFVARDGKGWRPAAAYAGYRIDGSGPAR